MQLSVPVILQYIISGLAQGSIYAIVALGFTIIFSATQVVNFAQGEFVMIGAMVSYWLIVVQHWPLVPAVLVAVAIAMAVGMLLGWTLMRSGRTGGPTSLIILTIGASILMEGVAGMIWGKDPVAVQPFTQGEALYFRVPVMLGGSPEAYPVVIQLQELWVMGLALLMVLGLTFFFNRTLVGKAMRAVAVNRHGARLVGINVSRLVISSFALSAAMGAVAGAAIAPLGSGSYAMGTMMGLKGFAAAIVGGLGSFPGSVIAGLVLGVAEQLGIGFIGSPYKDAIAFLVLLVVLIINPRGILAWGRGKARG
jgi:branched-chain amino acid transport system permease protein